ncbi:hypothetical protein DAI22_10g099100 [Oryza sativa Japonica Group]|nr:uncharacterized protein LOC107277697 [Oryza sativa Japonica Group]KAF2913622.1 hypothetical protein DAI22_10g099100 [Oryza sativa Japonica Group]
MDLTSLAGTVDSACFNTSISLPNSPRAASRSLTVSCVAVNCGPGGQRVKEEGFSYHCACSPGFVNMLNLTELPCIKNCAFGKDCAALGLSPASTPAPAPTPAGTLRETNWFQL